MQSIIPTLKTGDVGPAVANLIEALLLLVDRALIETEDETNSPAAEVAKAARREWKTSTFGPATRQLVVYFQLKQGLADKLHGLVEADTAARLNGLLKELGVLDEVSASTVEGRVTYADGLPASSVLVKLFEVGLCSKAFLKETSTSPAGTYELQYSLRHLDPDDIQTAGLIVEVHGPSDRLLVASPIQYGPASTRTVNLVLPASERAPSEYERYHASLRRILKDVRLERLQCDKGNPNLTYLAGVSGVPLDRLEMMVAAEQMAQTLLAASAGSLRSSRKNSSSHKAASTPISAAMFYAWMRLGEQREEILGGLPHKLVSIIKKAGEDNLIPAVPAKDLEAIASILAASRTERVLKPSSDGGPTTLGDALNLLTGSAALSDRQKLLLAELAISHPSGPAEDALKPVKLTPAQAASLRQIVALQELSAGDSSVLEAAHRHVLETSDATANLPIHAVADLEESDWQRILKTAKPALDTAGITKAAKNMVERTAQLFPNAFLLSRAIRQPDRAQLQADLSQAAKLQRNNGKIPAGDRRNVRAALERVTRLVNRYPGLGIDTIVSGEGSVAGKVSAVQARIGLLETFVNANPETDFLALDYSPESPDLEALKFTGLQDAEKAMVLRSMKANWRTFRFAGGALKARQVMEAGFHSATATAATTLEEFISATNLPADEAAAIHEEASDVALTASLQFMAVYNLVQQIGTGTSHPVHTITQPPEIVNHLKRFDGFKDLFGAQSICRCQHCRSVLGPAAYFVDVMRFIDKNITEVVFLNNPQADEALKLEYRRPDLWVLPLTCENADTLVPTLDIINEILENFINGNRTPTESQRKQIQKAVYLRLAQAKDSFAQPYVLPLKQIETYLKHFQLTRAQIARTLELDADTTARAQLGLSLVERDLIIDTGTNAQLDRLFGATISTSVNSTTQLFLALGAWTRDELGQMVETQFVQAGNAITIQSGKASAASVQNDREVVSGYSRPALDRLHRFTRLWRAVRRSEKWSIPEMDIVLSILASPGAPPALTSPMLVDIAKLLEIQKRFGISVEQLCALISDIPRTKLGARPSFFDRLFNLDSFVIQDGAWPPSPAPTYRHPSSLPANASAATVLANSRLSQRLMAGLQTTDENLVQILEGLNWFAAGVTLNLQNLTLLYRHSLLAQILQVEIPDLFRLLALGSIPNARVSDLAGLVQILKIFDDWKRTSFTIDDISVLTGGTARDASLYPDSSAIAKAVADEIRTGQLLEFAPTALSQIQGITSDQSRALIQQNPAVFESIQNSESMRLRPSADPSAGGFALTGVPQGVSSASIVGRLNLYHTRNVLEKLLAAQFRVSNGAMHQFSVMLGNVLTAHNTNLTQELYGSGLTPTLESIVARFVPLIVLFKNKVWDEDHLAFAASQGQVFGMTFPLTSPLTFANALNVASYVDYVAVRDEGFTSEEDTPDVAAVRTVLTQGFQNDGTVASALRVSQARVAQLKTYLSLDDNKPFEGLRKLAGAISLTDLLGLTGAALALIVPTTAQPTTEYNQLTDAAGALIAVVRSKYPDEQTFAQNIEPYDDILRGRKRDGLVEYLIRSMDRGFLSPSDLYQFFLIDTQVEGCARTARLVAAHGSLQLYVQRVLMNLERSGPDGANEFNVLKTLASKSVLPDPLLDRIQSEWDWRRTYRVWEANRKIFLYPESYLEPELRDDKTPPFKELESTLLQQRINEENATSAYAQYLESYEEAASLKIAGAFHDIDSAGKTDRLHLFGATSDDPPIFYYRTVDNVRFAYQGKRKSYTPWRKLNVQIPVREVSPVIVDGRLLIFWVQITTTPTNKVENGESRFVGYQHRFTFNYSEKRANDTWSPPQKLAAFGDGGLPFERLEDPLEEPIGQTLIGEIPTSKLKDALDDANKSETFFGPLPIMDTNDPSKFKTTKVTPPGSTTSHDEYVFRLVRLGPNPNNRGLEPRYAEGQKHTEPVDGYTLRTSAWTKVHAEIQGSELLLTGMDTNNLLSPFKERMPFVGVIDLFERTVRTTAVQGQGRDWFRLAMLGQELDWTRSPIDTKTVLFASMMDGLGSNAANVFNLGPQNLLGSLSDNTGFTAVNKAFAGGQAPVAVDAIIDFKNDLAMFLLMDSTSTPVSLERLGTTVRRAFRRQLFMKGLGGLLSLNYQNTLQESGAPVATPSSALLVPQNLSAFSFAGPFGVYFQEVFFHIPFLIANNLNSQQRFSAAQRWYHYIFDPTSSDTGPNRVWRYRKFKEELLRPDALRKALTDPDALEQYRRDPLNPHAIARLRPGSYQKAIVMKYIDNLLDWGDALFTEFTMESLNEATMLYALAADILGPRAVEVGDCGEASAAPLTYTDVSKSLGVNSDFLIELEHLSSTHTVTMIGGKQHTQGYLVDGLVGLASGTAVSRQALNVEETTNMGGGEGVGAVVGLMDYGNSNGSYSSWRSVGGRQLRSMSSYGSGEDLPGSPAGVGINGSNGGPRIFVEGDPINPPGDPPGGNGPIPNPGGLVPFDYKIPYNGVVKPGTIQPSNRKPHGGGKPPTHELVQHAALPKPVFCIPPNKDFMAYWDRVEDRLYKIRNCMDITGARRLPSLYAPEIDPRQLVKDKAAGLPLDDALHGITGNVPPYRFSFLVDKAKQYASTVQSFGNALLSALEKKDSEQLSRLRAVQEQNILKLRTRVQDLEIEAAEDTLASLERQRESVELRQTFYETLLQNGLIPWERTQQFTRHAVSELHTIEAVIGILGGVFGLLPNLGAPVAITYGGVQLKEGARGFGYSMQALAQVLESISASAGLEATFQRRDEDWQQQKKLADKELENVKKQIDSAKARLASARRSLEVHNKSVAQAEEIFQYYQDKFSSYGLYSLHSAQLQRSYREGYNAAFAVAKMAEQAYRYERMFDTATSLLPSYWAQDQAGLLAGERLLIDLQNFERRFLETNYRTQEPEQSFSLTQVDPSALVALRETGTCTFTIPDAFFNLAYPGQYRRRIKGVRLTVPCIVGPHTSVSARLELKDSEIQETPASQPVGYPLRHTAVVSFSTAQNDSGTFDFNFRDERYMPFEGAGAVNSRWELRLPGGFRSFDYRTISDVVLRISYTAEEDSGLRQQVDTLAGSIRSFLNTTGITRIFSLRHEFPDVWNQLVRKPLNSTVTFEITNRHLPYFLSYFLESNQGQTLKTSPIMVLLQTKKDLGNPGPRFDFNGTIENFATDLPTGLPGKATGNTQVVRTHTMKVLAAGALAPVAGQTGAIDESKLEDILLRVSLKLN